MRRTGGLFERIASFENLYLAYRRARRGKRHRESVERFSFDLESEILALRRDLLAGAYRPGPLQSFEIFDPKPRSISVAPFRDRVLQHAVLAVAEHDFERGLDFDSYACREGKGVDAALGRAVELSRRAGWVLRSDIEKCFDSIDHGRLKEVFGSMFKDRRLLDLLGTVIDTGGSAGRGVPIGSLLSQWSANLYLGRLDRFARQTIRPRGYLRYMDDFALFFGSRDDATCARAEVLLWCRSELSLELNVRVTAVQRVRLGWPFLGFRVSPDGISVRRATWTRFRKGLGRVYDEWRRGRLTAEEVAQSVSSRIAHLERARCRPLRRAAMREAEI